MDANDYLKSIDEAFSSVENTLRQLRTAVTTLYNQATFEPNKLIAGPSDGLRANGQNKSLKYGILNSTQKQSANLMLRHSLFLG